ncbi:MAG: prepilin-type N-terminal cleavage/methylation domain-containing protein [Comamonadaceae bacterium]|nr:MAG: prepilin-type N-terminal cleavage/methylation domain-containing protein [Comamonadaceae bacterium]
MQLLRSSLPKACTASARVQRKTAGFTLLELLVVMALMSLLILAMASALQTTSQTSERVDLALTRSDDLRIVSGFLQTTVGRISLQRRGYPVKEGTNRYYFEGQEAELMWLGVMPAGYAASGRSLMRLRQEVTDQGSPALVLQYLPWAGAAVEPDWSQATSHVLLNDVTQLQILYQDARPEPPVWSSSWTLADQVPQRVRIVLQTDRGALPDLVVSMRPLPASDPRSRGPIFGGDVR